MSDPVYVAVTRTIPTQSKEDYLAATYNFIQRSRSQPGVLDAFVLSNGQRPHEIGILRSFASEEDRRAFYASEMYQTWSAQAEEYGAGPAQQSRLHGLEAFFRHEKSDAGTDQPGPPARWKMALVTYAGVTPTVAIWMFIIHPQFGFGPLSNLLLSNVFIVAMLTWLVMPMLTTFLESFLFKQSAITQAKPTMPLAKTLGKWLLATPLAGDFASAVLRIITGISLAFIHGWHKVVEGFAHAGGAEWKLLDDVAIMGLPFPVLSAWFATIAQFIGGLALVVGFGVRPFALLAAGSMVGAIIVLITVGKNPELAMAYLLVLLFLAVRGPDRWTLDKYLWRKPEVSI